MANSKKRSPEYKITDNPHGIMFFGPGNSSDKADEGTQFQLSTSGGYWEHHNENGNSCQRVPGRYDEICGDGLDTSVSECIAKSIVAKQGDICIVSENGNIKLKAKNIYIEATGAKNNGVFQVAANGQITIATGDGVVISAGKKLCLRGQSGVDIASTHMIKMLGNMAYGSPLSTLPFLPKTVSNLIEGILESCK
jgi:hypothetical protein